MRTRIIVTIILLFTGLIIFTNCKHKVDMPGPVVIIPPVDTTQTGDTSVCFQRDILPIFTNSCGMSGCHNATTKAKGYDLTSYAGIMNKGVFPYHPNSSGLYTECLSGKMPVSPVPKLDSTKLSLVFRWINMGALNDTNCAPICDTTKINYSTGIAPILSFYCYSCHSSSSAAKSGAGIILDTYTGVSGQVSTGKLLGDIQHSTGFNAMPVGGSQLPDCKIIQVKKWILAGAQNN